MVHRLQLSPSLYRLGLFGRASFDCLAQGEHADSAVETVVPRGDAPASTRKPAGRLTERHRETRRRRPVSHAPSPSPSAPRTHGRDETIRQLCHPESSPTVLDGHGASG